MENLRVIHGTITLSNQMYEQALETERAIRDIESGKVPWDPDKVDWDAIEEMYRDD